MELYKYLDLLGGDRVYYFDSDSVLFTAKPGEVMPEKGNFLGQMTDELEGAPYGPGSYITEFVSGGPKNYEYKVYSPTTDETRTVVKVKGITLNYENSQVINFELMKNMVIGPDNGTNRVDSVEITNKSIRRTSLGDVYTTSIPKTYRFNYTKRQKIESENGFVLHENENGFVSVLVIYFEKKFIILSLFEFRIRVHYERT